MSVQWTVTNTGQGSTRPNETAWTDRVYLSDNGVLDTSTDTLLGSFPHNGGLAAGASYTQSQSLMLPVGISGPYTLFVVTDATNSVFEGPGQSNNVSSQPLTVNLTPPPDLQVGDISAPASAMPVSPSPSTGRSPTSVPAQPSPVPGTTRFIFPETSSSIPRRIFTWDRCIMTGRWLQEPVIPPA